MAEPRPKRSEKEVLADNATWRPAKWEKADATPQDFMRDNAACERVAKEAKAMRPEAARIRCLEGKGWRLIDHRP